MPKSRVVRLLTAALLALLLLWAAAWVALPRLLKWQLQARGSEMLGRELRVGEVHFAPTSLTLTLRDLSLAAAPAGTATAPQLQIERVWVDLDARSLLRLAPVVEALEIDAPRLRLARLSPGHYDIDDLLQRLRAPPKPADAAEKPARFALFNLRLVGGEISLDDRPMARKHEVRKLKLDLPFLSNLPDDLQVHVEPRLAFVLNGSAFESQGRSTPFAQGRASALTLRFDKFDLSPWWAYVPMALPVQAAGGTLAADLSLRFNQPETGAPNVDLQGQVDLGDIAFNVGDAPLLAWKNLRIRLADVRPLQRRVWLDAVQWDGAVLHVRRDGSGELEFERLASALRNSAAVAGAPAAATAAASSPAIAGSTPASTPGGTQASPPAAGAPAWQVQLALLELNGAQLRWIDDSLSPAVQVQLDDTQLRLKGLRWPVEADAALELNAQLRAAGKAVGQLHAEGALSDQQARLALRLTDVDLAAAEPYLRAQLRPQLRARLNADAEVDWARGAQPRLLLALPSLRVDDLVLSDAALSDAPRPARPAAAAKASKVSGVASPRSTTSATKNAARSGVARGVLLQVPQFEVTQLRVDALQRRVAIGAVSIQRPFIDLVRDATGALNVSSWTVGDKPRDATAPLPVASARPTSAKPVAAEAAGARAPTDVPSATAAAPAAAASGVAAASPWQLSLRQLKLDGGRVRFTDAALRAGALELDSLRASVQELAWPLPAVAAPWATQFSARLVQTAAAAGSSAATPARLDWNGRVALQPAGARGKLSVERFPVHVFEPYFGATLPLYLQRLEAGFKGEIDLRRLSTGVSGQVRGQALLADLRVTEREPAAVPASAAPAVARELLSFSAMAFNDLALSLPAEGRPLLEIGALRIEDYYSRLEITEEGNFNLQTVAAQAPGSAASATAASSAPGTPAAARGTTATSGARNAPAEAGGAVAATTRAHQQISAPSAMLSRLPIDILVGSTQIVNANVDFNDRFVRPNYSARLSELNGSVGRLDSRTRDLATLQVKGRVAGTGLLDIGGSINPTVNPPALDITAKATDIELPGLTPYSSKYAGYPIERGKLSVDVTYKIESDGKLEARNQIVINQLTFGPKSDSPTATKLPVRLAVALLQDRNGVIDLDLPLTGSISDPQFSIWALVWKVLGNLISKAVAAPFSAIGGGGKDLSTVEFEPGTARIAAASRDGVAKVAKALADRPGLKLSVVGQSDPVSERQAMQRAVVETRLLDEHRREQGRSALGSSANAGPAASAPDGTSASATTGAPADTPPALSPDERARALKRLYADTALPGKPRNLVGMSKDLPPAEMEALLEAAVPVDEAAARQLAVQRGRAVREALIAKGLGSERLFLGEAKLKPEGADNTGWTPHAQLTLSAN